jgi:hypothetical protein
MSKKSIITAIIIFILLLIISIGGFWIMREKERNNKDASQEKVKNNIIAEEDRQQNQEEQQQKFIVDVDMDVNHWQTKETEFFTIKFPKEWYWLESVITNNSDFDMVKNTGIGIFSDIGPRSPLTLSNNTEIVISERGKPTSNAGTPQDSLDAIFEMAKKNNPAVDCVVLNNKTIPFTAYCSVAFNNSKMRQQSYYIINEEITLTFTAWTTQENSKNLIDVLEKIAKSYLYES